MRDVRVAVIGAAGWMGKVHAMAYRTFPHFFGTSGGTARIVALVEANPAMAGGLRALHPEARILQDWRQAVTDPEVDLVDICLPDSLHHEVAKAALLAGKHVFCEKPLADTVAEARELAQIAREKGAITRVGHAFPRNPVHDLAREIVESGEIGEIRMFHATQHIDALGDPAAPFQWRADGALAPTGIVGDTGSHVFSFVDFLGGPVEALMADCFVGTAQRRDETGALRDVTNPDAAHVLLRFADGGRGLVHFSRIATGRKFAQTYEIFGTRGSLAYDYDEVNRLRVYSTADAAGRQGFRAIDVGPERSNYAAFLPLPNFALGYNEMKIIEVAEVVRSIASGQPMWPTFDDGLAICRMVEACMVSSREARWVDLASL